MKNWESLYEKVEKGCILNDSSLIRVTRKIAGTFFIGFVDEFGNEVIPCKYLWHKYSFQYGLLEVVNETGKIGFVNKSGIEVISCIYDKVSEIQDDIICVSIANEWGAINTMGREIMPLQYRFLGHLGHGLLLAQKFSSFKVGVLDFMGNVVIPFVYYQLGKVSTDNKIEYYKAEGGEHGFLDIKGNVVEILPI